MDAVRRKVNTYTEYEELWSEDYRLTVSYTGGREYDMVLRHGVWRSDEAADPLLELYLRSCAAVCTAAESCDRFGMPLSDIGKFLDPGQGLLPEELLRMLMDDRELSMEEALDVVVSVFGKQLCDLPDNGWLKGFQPRTAALNSLLRKELKKLNIAVHEPYDEAFRSPVGSVEEGTEVRLTLYTPGATSEVTLSVSGEDFALKLRAEKREGRFVCAFTPPTPGVYFYSFRYDGEETEEYQLTAYRKGFTTPDWFRRGIMYQIFPDRFGMGRDVSEGLEYHRALGQTPQLHGDITEPVKWQPLPGQKDYTPDDFYGGTLKGIAERLPYLISLGISVIYLNPIVEARSNHRYDCSDYGRVDPILGSNEDYVNLCREADRLGIRIVNDGVFSHTGADSVYFNRFGSYPGPGACQGEDSPYYKWYDFKSFPDEYRCWWGFKDLPEVEERDPDWQEFVVSGDDSIVKRWLRMGASGWRLDVADELPDGVLALIRDSVKAEKPDAVIIGEVWEDAVLKESYGQRRSYALGESLDTVMNYPFRTAVLAFAVGKSDSYGLKSFLEHQQHNYPGPMYPALMNLLGSHDVERLHTYLALGGPAGGMSREEQSELSIDSRELERATRLQMLCAAIQYTVPGVPCLYYGDEECLDGALDPFNRAPFEPERKGLYDYYVNLGRIRSSSSALLEGSFEIETPSPDVIILIREYGRERLCCVVNRSPEVFVCEDGTPLLCGKNEVAPYSAEIFSCE